MPFILPDKFLGKLSTLRKDYEKETGLEDLSKAKQPYGISCFFGATDVQSRTHQITLIEKIQKALLSKIPVDEAGNFKPTTEDSVVQAYFLASRVLLAARLYVKWSIEQTYYFRSPDYNSHLLKLLDAALALPEGNTIDEQTRICVLKTTQQYINQGPSELLNKDLDNLLSDPEWVKFTQFINQECKALGKHPAAYPISRAIVPVFGTVGFYTGLPVGFILGETFARSTIMQPVRTALTTALGTVLLLASGGGGTISIGLMLIAPPYAGYLLEAFCEMTFAAALGSAMSLVGRGVGWAVGMPLDMTYTLACYALASLSNRDGELIAPISGFNIVNGDYYFSGVKIPTVEQDTAQVDLSKMKLIQLEPTSEGLKITVGDDVKDQVLIPYDREKLPKEQQVLLQQLEAAMKEKGILPTAEQTFKAEEEKEEALKEVNEPIKATFA